MMFRELQTKLMFSAVVAAVICPLVFADDQSTDAKTRPTSDEVKEQLSERLDTANLEASESVEVTVDPATGQVSDTVTSETTVIKKEGATTTTTTTLSTSAEAKSADAAPSADDVRKSLLDDLAGPPVTTPSRREMVKDVPSSVGVPAVTTEIDPAVLGIAPGQTPPKLRREGEFIINRRGRLIRSPRSNRPLFVFEADTKGAGQELPMLLLPCRLLQDMEQTVMQQGDQVLFIVSGQVHSYRGANYLMPTTMRLAVDRGNTD